PASVIFASRMSGCCASTCARSLRSVSLSASFFDSGPRPKRIAEIRSPLLSQNASVAQPISRYPAGPLLRRPSAAASARTSVGLAPPSIGASTPSMETAIECVSSGTTIASRKTCSYFSRSFSQRSPSVLGNRSRLLLDGSMLPTRANSASAFCGVICVTTHDACSAARVVQNPLTIPSLRSSAARACAVGSHRSLYSHRSTLTGPAAVMYVCVLRSTRRCTRPAISIASASTSDADITPPTIARSGLARHRVIFEEFSQPVEHPIVKRPLDLAGTKGPLNLRTYDARAAGALHAASTRAVYGNSRSFRVRVGSTPSGQAPAATLAVIATSIAVSLSKNSQPNSI